MRSTPLLALLAAIVLLSGCGDSSEEATTAPGGALAPPGAKVRICASQQDPDGRLGAVGVSCATARSVRGDWERRQPCRPPAGGSRAGCSVGAYRCQATAAGRGWSVSCAAPGRTVAFTVPR